MKLHYTLIFSIVMQLGFAQSASLYFDKIRTNEAALTAFFSQMPKGGDLHHHYSGSIYAEPILNYAITENFLFKYRNNGRCQKKTDQRKLGPFFGFKK
jgi:adenosine deaminase/adenosine deaminase CECR1